MLPNPDWRQMSEAEISAADTSNWIAVLPLGASEQHGPHLPIETDTIIARGICERLKPMLTDIPVTFLNVEEIGYSPEHSDYPTSKTLTYEDAIKRWVSFGEMLHSYGIRKMLLLNAHGGNSPLMTIVATELRCRFDMLCAYTSWTRFGAPEEIVGSEEKDFGIHGGDIETSVMLSLAPELVDMEKAGDHSSFQAELNRKNEFLRAYGRHGFGWKMQDLNPVGVVGNSAAATSDKGEALLEEALMGLVTLLEEIDHFDLKNLQSKPIF